MFTILFVCTGNTCRSSMAEAICNHILQTRDRKDIKVISSGTMVADGSPAVKEAVQALNEKNIDISEHKAKQLTSELIFEADLILTMTRSHKEHVITMVPSAIERTYTLKEYVLKEWDDSVSAELLETVAELEKKEQEFFSRDGKRIKKLKAEYNQLQEKLRFIEQELMALEEQFILETREQREKIKSLKDKLDLDISDPYGQPVEIYRQCAEELEENIKQVMQKFLGEVEDKGK